MWIPIVLVGLGLAWVWSRQSRGRPLLPKHRAVLEKAALSENSPAISEVAGEFDSLGYHEAARRLRARSQLSDRSPERKRAHSQVMRRAIAAPNYHDTRDLARAFDDAGMTYSALMLNQHADALKRADEVQPISDFGRHHGGHGHGHGHPQHAAAPVAAPPPDVPQDQPAPADDGSGGAPPADDGGGGGDDGQSDE
jgi:hypothetical protein